MYMQRHGMESKPKTTARSRKKKNRKGIVGDKCRSGTDAVLGDVYRHNSGHCNAEPIWAAGPPEFGRSGFPGSITAVCMPVGQALLCQGSARHPHRKASQYCSALVSS